MTTTRTTPGLTGTKAKRLRSTARDPQERCWQYGRIGCKNKAENSVRIGSHIYRYCDEHPAPGASL